MLPDVDFVELSSKEIEQEIFNIYESITGRKLYPGNPERLFLEAVAYMISLQRWKINYSAKQNLLAYAKGDFLDHLGDLLGVKRLEAQPARVVVRFYVGEPLDFDVVIPQGTRVTVDGTLFFKTEEESKIKAGEEYEDVECVCETAGTIGNGFVEGQINILVDLIPYVSKVENVTISLGGTDREDDEHFRERIRLAPESFSNAGSKEAYIFHTKSAHQDIEDVEVFSPEPGKVRVIFTLKGGNIPNDELIALVSEYLSGEKIRPLTDFVEVSAPSVVNYDIDLTYFILKDMSAFVSLINSQVNDAVEEYIRWQKEKIGRDILPEELIYRLKKIEGVQRIILNSPSYRELAIDEIAICQSINISYGGVIDG